jgi:MFS family permease
MAQGHMAREDTTAADPTTAAAAPKVRTAAPRGGFRTFSSLQNNRDYRFLFTGNLFSNCAQWLQFITVGWMALDISGSALHSILTVAVRATPTLLLGPWAGVLADRWDRRKLAMALQVLISALTLAFAVLVARGQVDKIWHLYAFMVLSGIGFTLKQPVRQALVANTVRRADMANALALNAMAVTSMRLVGAALGGILIETVDFQWNFFVEGSLYLVMVLLLIPMRAPYQEAGTARRASPLSNVVEGLSYMLKNRVMLRLLVINLVRAGVFMPLILLLPAYTQQSLNAGAAVGTAMIFSMGIGGVIATVIMSSWGFFNRKGLLCLITLLVGSVVVLSLGLSHWVWYSVPIMAVMGLAQTTFIVGNQTLIQMVVPDALRGRVSSVWHYESGLVPLFAGLIGVVAEFRDIAFAMILAGAIAVGLSLWFMARFKDIRALD